MDLITCNENCYISDVENLDQSADVDRSINSEVSDTFYQVQKRMKRDMTYSSYSWYPYTQNVCLNTKFVKIPDEVLDLIKTHQAEIVDIKDSDVLKLFKSSIESTIKELGGICFVRTNWHAPTDARPFSLNKLLKCTNSYEALFYIGCSDVCLADFSKNIGKDEFYLQFSEWKDIHPSTEFRCIVVHGHLVAISPKDWPAYHSYLVEEGKKLIDQISRSFREFISRFPEEHYIFDIIVPSETSFYLLGFEILNSHTKLGAFNWDEISKMINKSAETSNVDPVMRYMEQPQSGFDFIRC